MNYIKEINAFYDHQEREPLSGSAVALWFALMHMNNKTRWKNTFTSPGSVLQNKAGLSASSFKRARTELVNAGYIEVESQGRSKAPIYKMHSLVVELAEEEEHAEEIVREEDLQEEQAFSSLANQAENQQPVHPMNHSTDHSTDHYLNQHVDHSPDHHPNQDPIPLIKQYKNKTNTKENNDDAAAAGVGTFDFLQENKEQESEAPDALKFYQENFGVLSSFVAESLMDWIQSLGEELVMEAMKRALDRNILTWAYVKSILKAWDKKGIRTVAEADAELVAFENERTWKRAGSFAGSEDIVPDWYYAERRKQQEREREREAKEKANGKEAEVELERLMREYWGEVRSV